MMREQQEENGDLKKQKCKNISSKLNLKLNLKMHAQTLVWKTKKNILWNNFLKELKELKNVLIL